MTVERHTPDAKRTTHIIRDASTGKYTIRCLASNGVEVTVEPGEKPPRSPETFLQEFTSSPVVDDLMRRLSR